MPAGLVEAVVLAGQVELLDGPSLAGVLLGLIGGISLATNVEVIVQTIEQMFNTKFLDPTLYYISTVPSDVREADLYTVALVGFLITLVATLYPAWSASRTQPAEVLRYE